MTNKKRLSEQYYLSVEGETEQWYFEWLKNTINSSPNATRTIKLKCKVQKDPIKYAKGLIILEKTLITHIFDRESEEDLHTGQFTTTLERMRNAPQKSGKTVEYRMGYSNFTFELWMVLHKSDCNAPKTHRRQYLDHINNAYDEHFENLDQYKHEGNFKRLLGQLTLTHVQDAIRRSKEIMQKNKENGYICSQEHGYSYYKENPSLSIWECVEKMLKDCCNE